MMNKFLSGSYAALFLRVTLGSLSLVHGLFKLFVFTPAGTAMFFNSLGLPGPLAYVVIILEIAAGIGLVLGFKTRMWATALILDLLGAIVSVHFKAGFFFNNPNGGWEFPALWIAALIALILIGDGTYALSSSKNRIKNSSEPIAAGRQS